MHPSSGSDETGGTVAREFSAASFCAQSSSTNPGKWIKIAYANRVMGLQCQRTGPDTGRKGSNPTLLHATGV